MSALLAAAGDARVIMKRNLIKVIRVPDILVSDIAMPGEDGYTLIRKVRALGAARALRDQRKAQGHGSREDVSRPLGSRRGYHRRV